MIRRSTAIHFDDNEKREIIEEYLKGGRTKVDIWLQYAGPTKKIGK